MYAGGKTGRETGAAAGRQRRKQTQHCHIAAAGCETSCQVVAADLSGRTWQG